MSGYRAPDPGAPPGSSNPPSESDVADDFARHQAVVLDGFEPHSVSALLGTDGGNAYPVALDIVY